MATTPDFGRSAPSPTRPLTDDVFDALREAVVVVDPRSPQLPLILANATARRCLGENAALPTPESTLYSRLGAAADSVLAAAQGTLGRAKASARILN